MYLEFFLDTQEWISMPNITKRFFIGLLTVERNLKS